MKIVLAGDELRDRFSWEAKYQINCPSAPSEGKRGPFDLDHHSSRVRIGETASNLRSLSLESFLFFFKVGVRSRRLMKMVNLSN